MKKTFLYAVLSAALALPAFAEVDCLKLSLSVKNSVAADQAKVLEIVTKEVTAASGCACEIVKAAIEGSGAKPQTVAAIVEAAANAAPDQIRMIAQCAVAVAPDALADVQAVLAKLDPNKGESAESAKGAKAPASEVAAMPNPLDFPGVGPVSPTFGGPGGNPLIPVFPPVIINPPEVTQVD
jgi:hypothetical protein